MKYVILLMFVVCHSAIGALTITPIWQFPNTATPSTNWLFVLSSSGAGNHNISVAQLKTFYGISSNALTSSQVSVINSASNVFGLQAGAGIKILQTGSSSSNGVTIYTNVISVSAPYVVAGAGLNTNQVYIQLTLTNGVSVWLPGFTNAPH